jgi:hypothetical protein
VTNTNRNKRNNRPVLQLKLRGPGVRRGRISVPDLLKICAETQNVINKQAEVVKGRKTIHPGPVSGTIQGECTLELVAIRDGSTILEFDLAKPQMHFGYKERFGAEVVAEVGVSIKSLQNRKSQPMDPGLLLGLYNLGGIVEGKSVQSIRWITPNSNGSKAASVAITRAFREKTAARLSRPQRIAVQVDGILDMADFRPEELRCRIDPAIGTSILCVFERDKADLIYQLMRKPVRVKGIGTLKPYTERVEQIHIEEIDTLPSLNLGEGNFFANRSIQELAKMQKVTALKDISVLEGGIPEDEDVDRLVEEIYAAR